MYQWESPRPNSNIFWSINKEMNTHQRGVSECQRRKAGVSETIGVIEVVTTKDISDWRAKSRTKQGSDRRTERCERGMLTLAEGVPGIIGRPDRDPEIQLMSCPGYS